MTQSGHRAVPPKVRGVATVTAHVGDGRHAPRQTNLAAMGVTREIKAEASVSCDIGLFRGMDEGNLKAIRRGLKRRPIYRLRYDIYVAEMNRYRSRTCSAALDS